MNGRLDHNSQAPPPVFYRPPYADTLEADHQRFNVYAYDNWQLFPSFQLQAGLSYDQLDYPLSLETLPAIDDQTSQSQWSPKAGFLWTIRTNTHLRGAWTRSLGGAYYDASLRLEPVQVAGFTQAYRSVIPESAPGAVAGLIPGAEFETWGLAIDHRFPTRTYVGIDGQWLQEKADRAVGAFNYRPGQNAAPSYIIQNLDYDEQNLGLFLHQLLSRDFSLGVRYGFSHAQLDVRYPELHPQASAPVERLTDEQADLHQISCYMDFHHPCGFFSRAESQWFQQTSHGYQPRLPGEDFWQINLLAGYRFRRRAAEVQMGLLNLTDQDYRLNPLNCYPYLMRERTFTCRLRLNF
jgi:hypothetical protein